MTGTDGHYSFSSIPFGSHYEVKPELNSAHTDGISSMDLVILLKHILGIETLEDPYQYLAADIDGSGHVSVNDLLDLKDIVLRNYYELPTETSWRFVDAAFDFDGNMDDPLSVDIPESYLISSFDADMTGLNFIGVKVGDLTGDYTGSTGLVSGDARSGDVPLIIHSDREAYRRGDEVELDILIDGSVEALHAIQYTLRFDQNKVEFAGVVNATSEEMEPSVHGLSKLDEGVITGLWFDAVPATSKAALARMSFRALEDLDASDILTLYKKPTEALAYTGEGVEAGVALEFDTWSLNNVSTTAELGMFDVGANYPNPFSRQTAIPVTIAEAAMIDIEIFDAAGRVVYAQSYSGHRGRNDILLDSDEINAEGLLMCRVSIKDNVETIRMLSLK
jgi:hypothetical protein